MHRTGVLAMSKELKKTIVISVGSCILCILYVIVNYIHTVHIVHKHLKSIGFFNKYENKEMKDER